MTQYDNVPARRASPAFSLPSIIAIVAAIASFFVGAGWGFILAIVAIIFGLIGALLAVSPNVRGGIVSIFSILAGVIGIVAAIIKLVIG